MKVNFYVLMVVIGLMVGMAYSQHKISRSVIASGGVKMIGTQHTIQGTIGQGIIGKSCGTHCIGSGFWSGLLQMATRVPITAEGIPLEFRLEQNYPNPFNPSTVIRFALPHQTHLSLKLYDVLGREVKSIADGEFPAGYHNVLLESHGLASGPYFYRLQANDFVAQRRLLLLK